VPHAPAMTFAHAIVWIDHQRAELVHLSSSDEHTAHIERPEPRRRLRRKSGTRGTGRTPVSRAFFDEIAGDLHDVSSVLIVGPGIAKVEFAAHLTQRHPAIARRVVGLEAMDHPSHAELVRYARSYFKRVDQLEGVDLR
jgi:stalled ribosome rescue protein Dom34